LSGLSIYIFDQQASLSTDIDTGIEDY
jgi:hypothetical protein